MAGVNGRAEAFRSGVNVRIAKFTPLFKDTTDTTPNQEYATLATAANAAGFLGVLIEHFVEPNYFVAQGTDPTTVTGTAPVLYNLKNRGITLQIDGIARFYCASAINQGDAVNLAAADSPNPSTTYSTRVKTATETAGTKQIIGTALNTTQSANDVVMVAIRPHLE